MRNNRKVYKIILITCVLLSGFISCKQSWERSCLDALTHGNVGYWVRVYDGSYGAVVTEYSKKDSTIRFIYDGEYGWPNPHIAMYGLKFKIENDTLSEYINKNGHLIPFHDPIFVIKYSRDTMILRNKRSDIIVWKRMNKKKVFNER